MDVKKGNRYMNGVEIDHLIINIIKELILNNSLTIIELGQYLNKYKNSDISITKNNKKRKLNTLIKEIYGGLAKYIDKSDLFYIINNKINIIQEEDFVLI